MISIEEGRLCLVPNPDSEMPYQTHELLFGHVCPGCHQVIHGMLRLTPGPGGQAPQTVPLWRYGAGDEKYVSRLAEAPAGVYGQYFWESVHFSPGSLQEAVDQVSVWGRCSYLKGLWEPNPVRRTQRVLRHLRSLRRLDDEVLDRLAEAVGRNHTRCEVFLLALQEKAGLAEDVKGGPPVILLGKYGWETYQMRDLVEKVVSDCSGGASVEEVLGLAAAPAEGCPSAT